MEHSDVCTVEVNMFSHSKKIWTPDHMTGRKKETQNINKTLTLNIKLF